MVDVVSLLFHGCFVLEVGNTSEQMALFVVYLDLVSVERPGSAKIGT